MCISAEVSFGLSGVLLLTGAVCLIKASHLDRRMLPLAVIPVVFGIQQFCEGLVWMGINGANAQLLRTSALVFLFFALFFWPAWIPISALLMEPRKSMRPILLVLSLLGVLLGAALFIPILTHPNWLIVKVLHHSVEYDTNASPIVATMPSMVWQLLYLAIVAVPLLVSPLRRIFHLGMAIVLSAAVSHVFFSYAAESVWCFFAAALSIYLTTLFFRMPAPMRSTPGATR